MSPVIVVLVEHDQILDRLAHLRHMADEHDQPAFVLRDQAPDPVHRPVEMLRIEAPEALVQEEGIEAPAPARDHLGQRERERERREERLAAGEAVGLPLLPAAFRSTMSNRSSSVNR